jgi:hypothetical protein
LKELDLLSAEVSTQSSIDVILQAIVHSNEGFRMKYKGKEVCPSLESVSGIVESMVSPRGMEVSVKLGSNPRAKPRDLFSNARMMDIGQEIVQSI